MKQRKFCPFCGSNEVYFVAADDGYQCKSCGEVQYLNSKPSVAAVLLRGNEILLVNDHEAIGEWDFPGGFLNHGESPIDGLRREMKEELNIDVEVGSIIDALVDKYGRIGEYSLNLFYWITRYESNIWPSSEIIEAAWFDFYKPPLLKYASTAQFIKNLREGRYSQ